MNEPLSPEKTLTQLVGDLTREASALLRQEIALAKTEFAGKISKAGSGVAELAVGAAITFLALQALLAAAVIALAQSIGWWQSALVLGVAVLLVGAALLIRGLANVRAESLAPQRTLASLRESRDWAREQIK